MTYSNVADDFSGVHAHLDALLPAVRANLLGRTRPNLIAGREDEDGVRYTAPSPINRDWPLGSFFAASSGAVDRAVAAAGAAYPDWSRRPWAERVAALRRAADRIESQKYEIACACLFEVGKSRMEAVGEVEEAIDLIRYYCDEMAANGGYDRPMRRAFAQEATRCVLRPHGVFAVIAPFNFPVALSVAMMSGALLGGNTVVYKPSPMAGLTGRLIVDAFVAAGLPPGAVNLICGGGEVGQTLGDHPAIAGIAFTGSHAVGMEILRRMAARTYARPVIAEMGGKNPAYVTANADLDAASSGVMRSAFGLSGQKCSAGSTVFVHDAVADDFLARLVDKTTALKVGDPQSPDVFVGPVINRAAADRFERAADSVRQQGRFAAGGEILTGGDLRQGLLRRARDRRRPAGRPRSPQGGALPAAPDGAALRRSCGGDPRRQRRALRPHRRDLHARRGRAAAVPRHRRGRRPLRQPGERRDHRRLARHPDLLRLERLRRHG